MKGFWKRLFARLKNPSRGVLVGNFFLTVIASTSSVIAVCVGYTSGFSYILYAVAAISLSCTVYTAVRFAPRLKCSVQRGVRRFAFTRKMTENYSFRTRVFAWCSAVVNLVFTAFHLVMGILTKNAWYTSLAGYYFFLSCLRGGVFFMERRAKRRANGDGELYKKAQIRNYGYCGGALFLLDVAMAVSVTFMVIAEKPTKYTKSTAIVYAAYSFYKIALAIRNIFKAKKNKDRQIQAFRNISLVDAAISLLSLQTTMIATFSENGGGMYTMNAIVGALVCLFTAGVGVVMIVQARQKIKESGHEKI